MGSDTFYRNRLELASGDMVRLHKIAFTDETLVECKQFTEQDVATVKYHDWSFYGGGRVVVVFKESDNPVEINIPFGYLKKLTLSQVREYKKSINKEQS